jgi:hypothetical protein
MTSMSSRQPGERGLTPAEDEELRRLAALAEFGALTPQLAEVFLELRARDRRTQVREPREVAVLMPVQRSDEVSPASAAR